MQGVLNIDKPLGVTSHDVVNRVRRTLGLRRVGHAGTLDPLATGVLVLCVGRATRLLEYVVGQPKQYVATLRLGQTTDTYDAEGDIVAERAVAVSDAALAAALDQFRGEIEQVPPIYSAIKRDGQPLYKLARKGMAVEAPPARPITIYQLDLLAREGDDVTLRVDCSTGTYIRSLAHDLGQMLGCGGHLIGLRRTHIGHFSAETSTTLDQLTPADLMAPDTTVAHLPKVVFSAELSRDLLLGKPIPRLSDEAEANLVRAYADDGQFLGVLQLSGNRWKGRKLFPPV